MIKETKVMKEAVEKHKFCDVCGAEIDIGLSCSAAHCMYCRKDLCEKCIGYEEDDGSDWRTVYCKRCWDIGEAYRDKIEVLEIDIRFLYKEWQLKCKEEEE